VSLASFAREQAVQIARAVDGTYDLDVRALQPKEDKVMAMGGDTQPRRE
jgi:hypothetical protein